MRIACRAVMSGILAALIAIGVSLVGEAYFLETFGGALVLAGLAYAMAGAAVGFTLDVCVSDHSRRARFIFAGVVGGAGAGPILWLTFVGRPLMWWLEGGRIIIPAAYYAVVAWLGPLALGSAIALGAGGTSVAWGVFRWSALLGAASLVAVTLGLALLPGTPTLSPAGGIALCVLLNAVALSAVALGAVKALAMAPHR